MRRFAAILATLTLGALQLTCGGGLIEAEVHDVCVEDPDLCPPCTADSECVFQGNSCTDYVACAHPDADLAFVQIGCSEALERRWPENEACACVDQVCQSGLDESL